MRIERLKKDDIPPLAELFRQFWGEKSSTEKMTSIFSRIKTNPAYTLLAAKQKDRLVGFAMGIICEELYGNCNPFMVIEDVIVDKRQRGNGVGSALMRELEKDAMAHDCCQIIFITEANRTDALRFYRSLGYEFEPYKGFKKKLGAGQQNNG
jgi:ribosomal protein S18 acetylase RimI-like enzyme